MEVYFMSIHAWNSKFVRICANKFRECGMYIGLCEFSHLFDDEDVSMIQGIDKCKEVLASNNLFEQWICIMNTL